MAKGVYISGRKTIERKENLSSIEKHSDVVAICLLWIVCLYTLQICLSVQMLPPWEILFGFGVTLTLTVLRLFKMGGLKAVLATALFLGSCYFFQIVFKYDSYRISRYLFSIYYSFFPEGTPRVYNKFWFEPVSMTILIIFLLLNGRVLLESFKPKRENELIKNNDSILPISAKVEAENSRYYLEKYYTELVEKENEYLESIVASKLKWQKEYILAAEKILIERTQKS